jgi:hypothetical protein
MSSDLALPDKSPVRLQRFADLQFTPHFEYGHMAEAKDALVAYAIHPSNWQET